MPEKKQPIRMCTGCREGHPKRELVRVVRTPEGAILVDLTGRQSGRGAYLCRKSACLTRARKARSLERALQCEIGPDIYERLMQEIEEAQDGGSK